MADNGMEELNLRVEISHRNPGEWLITPETQIEKEIMNYLSRTTHSKGRYEVSRGKGNYIMRIDLSALERSE